jgi:hypothetical protein
MSLRWNQVHDGSHPLTIAGRLAEVSDVAPAQCPLGIAKRCTGDDSMAKKEAAKVQENKTVELPSAKELMKQIAQKEAEKASEYMRRQAAAEREKTALIERRARHLAYPTRRRFVAQR